jgi:autoinducer 2-degrading protein
MLIVHVHVHVLPEHIEAFREVTVENARNSINEPGIARFDVLQHSTDASRFILVEVYRNAEAPTAHKATAHYQLWRDRAAPMMAEPRTNEKYDNVFPVDQEW